MKVRKGKKIRIKYNNKKRKSLKGWNKNIVNIHLIIFLWNQKLDED